MIDTYSKTARLSLHAQIFGGDKNDASQIKDYGNISSSGNNSVDLIDDLYAQFPFTINLPLDLASSDATMNNQSLHLDGIDLSMLTKGLLPSHAAAQSEKNKIWTFETILNDLEADFNRNQIKTQSKNQ